MAKKVVGGAATEVRFGVLTADKLAQEVITAPEDVVVTMGGAATVGAGTLTVTALVDPLPAGSALLLYPTTQFVQVTLGAEAAKGTTTLTVTALADPIPAKSKIKFVGYDFDVEVAAAAADDATTITVRPLKQTLTNTAVGYYFTGTPAYAYTTDEVATGGTVVPVLPLNDAIANGSVALHKGLLLLQGGTSASDEISTDEETVTIFGDEAGYSTGSATGAGWSMDYEALVLALEPGYYRLSYAARNAVKGVTCWVQVREEAPAGYTYGEQVECVCQVLGRSKDRPSDGNITLSTSFAGRGEPIETPPRK